MNHDDLEDGVEYYKFLCDWIDSNSEGHPIAMFTALTAAIWYICPSMGLDATTAIVNISNLLARWELRRKKREKIDGR